jgi:hypothetical protein
MKLRYTCSKVGVKYASWPVIQDKVLSALKCFDLERVCVTEELLLDS